MNTRREFIVQSGRALGAWLVGAGAARRILWLATEKEEPYLVEVESPDVELWATNLGREFVFSLGCSYYSITGPHLTWRDQDVLGRHEGLPDDSGWSAGGRGRGPARMFGATRSAA